MSILTAAFLLFWWPMCICLLVQWNSVGSTGGFNARTLSYFVNPSLIICFNSQLKAKVAAWIMFRPEVSE